MFYRAWKNLNETILYSCRVGTILIKSEADHKLIYKEISLKFYDETYHRVFVTRNSHFLDRGPAIRSSSYLLLAEGKQLILLASQSDTFSQVLNCNLVIPYYQRHLGPTTRRHIEAHSELWAIPVFSLKITTAQGFGSSVFQ